jgi:glycosyltransferase involved in cell wall biosynthesis
MYDTMLSSPKFKNIHNNDKLLQNTKKKSIHNSIFSKKCFPTKNKIFWKNQTDLEIEKNKAEVLNSKSKKISFENNNDFYKRKKPKISIIITVYNQKDYIKSAYTHIQNQQLKDIEIIFVDDASTDNSSMVIKELMNIDERIIYLKNDINKKQFYSINKGVINSKGEYILSVDPDDFLLNNILIKAYETAKFYDLDVLEFYILSHLSLWDVKYQSGIICGNSNVRNIFYFGKTRNLPDKLIRRSIFLKAINFMPKEIYNEDYQSHTDDTTFFGIIHFANSYGFLEQIGYFYNTSPKRKPKILLLKDKNTLANEELKSLFNIMKYFIIKTDNNSIEKNFIAFRFFYDKVRKKLNKNLKYITFHFQFFLEVLNLYLNCSFFSKEDKDIILKYKRKIIIKKSYYK